MDDVYMLPIFMLFFACFLIFILVMIKKHLSRVFTEKYSVLKQQYPSPLYTWGGLSGSLSTKWIFPFIFRGMLKIDVYEKMIIVSSIGQSICLPYDKYIFTQKQQMSLNNLIIENLPVYDKRKYFPFLGPIDFSETTTLRITLTKNKINTILSLAQK